MNTNDVIKDILAEIKQPLWENWYIKECIGTGAFSAVYKIEAKRVSRVDTSALKIEPIIGDERFMQNEERYKAFLDNKRREYENESGLMYKLRNCTNIVKYEEEDIRELVKDGRLIGYYFLIRMELLQNVYDLMLSHNFKYSEKNIRKLALDIAHALEAAHDIGVIHRDVKPANFFVSRDGVYKLGDFNIAKQTSAARSFAGTEGYIAPEVYRAKTSSKESYNAQADIYSFGICLYQLMNDALFPFEEDCSTEDAIDRRMLGEKLEKPKNASDDFARIILKACAYEPSDRYQNIKEMIADLEQTPLAAAAIADDSDDFVAMPAFADNNATVYASTDHVNAAIAAKAKTQKQKNIDRIKYLLIPLMALVLLVVFFVVAELTSRDEDDEKTQASVSDYVSDINSTAQTAITTLTTTSATTTTATGTTTTATSTTSATTTTTATAAATTVATTTTTKASTTTKAATAATTKATTTTTTAATQAVPACLEYEISNGKVTITDCDDSATGAFVIPSTIEGYPVTSIGEAAFEGCYNSFSITIPNSVTSIGWGAFSHSGLTSITIPSSVTNIEDCPFGDCNKLTSINVDPSNTNYCSIDGVLYSKGKTKIIAYPNGKTATSFDIPNSVTSIADYVFFGCDDLTSITIPDSVETIGEFAMTVHYLTDVYYKGTQQQWYAIEIGDYNDELTNATIHYNS